LKTGKGQKCWEQVYLGIGLPDIRSVTEGQGNKESLNTKASLWSPKKIKQRKLK